MSHSIRFEAEFLKGRVLSNHYIAHIWTYSETKYGGKRLECVYTFHLWRCWHRWCRARFIYFGIIVGLG